LSGADPSIDRHGWGGGGVVPGIVLIIASIVVASKFPAD